MQDMLGAENIFILFGVIAVLSLLFIIVYVPETKGLSLEEIEMKVLKWSLIVEVVTSWLKSISNLIVPLICYILCKYFVTLIANIAQILYLYLDGVWFLISFT